MSKRTVTRYAVMVHRDGRPDWPAEVLPTRPEAEQWAVQFDAQGRYPGATLTVEPVEQEVIR